MINQIYSSLINFYGKAKISDNIRFSIYETLTIQTLKLKCFYLNLIAFSVN
jgi:hypothetical protein